MSRWIATGMLAGAIVACSPSIEEVSCDTLATGAPSGTGVVLLMDQPSPSARSMIDQMAERPQAIADGLGLELPGHATLAVYGAGGVVDEVTTVNLNGVGNTEDRRRISARTAGRCLVAAYEGLDASQATGDAPAANTLRALRPAAALAAVKAGGDGETAVLVTGLSRSTGDGFDVDVADLSDTARPDVWATLESAGLVPDLADTDPSVRFVAPTEGVESGIAAASIDRFANELCPKLLVTDCRIIDEVGVEGSGADQTADTGEAALSPTGDDLGASTGIVNVATTLPQYVVVPEAVLGELDIPGANAELEPVTCSLVVSLPSDEIGFVFDSAELSDAGEQGLLALAERLQGASNVTVVGHSSSEGAEDYNQRLSERRAQAVAEVLRAAGVAVKPDAVTGAGESDPAASNDTEAGQRSNRRVEITGRVEAEVCNDLRLG